MKIASLRTIVFIGAFITAVGAAILFARPRTLEAMALSVSHRSPTNLAAPVGAVQLRTLVSRAYEILRTPASQDARRPPVSATDSAVLGLGRNGCWSMDSTATVLTLRIYRGMTLSDLAEHFNTTVAQLRDSNPRLRRAMLLAGKVYRIPIGHLHVVHHRLQVGETMSGLAKAVHAPNAYSIRTWNCLDSSRLRAGRTVLLFRFEPPAHHSATNVNTVRPR